MCQTLKHEMFDNFFVLGPDTFHVPEPEMYWILTPDTYYVLEHRLQAKNDCQIHPCLRQHCLLLLLLTT